MSLLLFRLNGVPADEADEVRTLLSEHNIDFYETSAGNWGASLAAIWLKNEIQLNQAKELLGEYAVRRQSIIQAEYKQRLSQGKFRLFFSEFIENPIRSIIYIAVVAAVIYFSTMPFLSFGE